MSVEWENKDFVWSWPEGDRPWVSFDSVPQAALSFWQSYQHNIMPELQKWLDNGWEPVSEVGPGAFKLRYFKSFRAYGVFGLDTYHLLRGWLSRSRDTILAAVQTPIRRGNRVLCTHAKGKEGNGLACLDE